MSYTINPNAKNRWARNAENTMDLSLETDASSVYLDNGRTLEQEIGEGSMVSSVTTVDSAMSKVIDGTLDGAYESLVFKGKSLVNIHPISYTISASGATTYFAGRDIDKTKIKSGTRYFLRLLDTDPTVCRAYFKPCNVNTISFADINDKYAIFTTKSELTDSDFSNNKIHFYTNTSKTLEDVANTKIILCEYQEGMENWDIPYFTGLCDVKMPILRNIGKNLLSPSYIQRVYFGVTVGSPIVIHQSSSGAHSSIVKYPCKVGDTYTLTYTSGNADRNIVTELDANDVVLKTSTIRTNTYTVTNSNTKKLCWYIGQDVSNPIPSNAIMLEVGEQQTGFENHKTNILRTSEEVVLREVNGVQDTYNPLTGEYVKRIGEVVLDGSDNETWGSHEVKGDNVKFAYYPTLVAQGSYQYVECLCDKWRADNQANESIQEQISLYNHMPNNAPQTEVRITVSPTRLQSVDTTGFRAWLSQNPLTVQYILAKPITTIVEPSTTPFAYENGHIILESGHEGQSLLPTLEYSTVVNKTGLVENVAKTIQRQEKQLTMLEKMLIKNIINLDYNNTLLTLKNEMEEML